MGQPVEVVTTELHSASARFADAAQHLQDGLASVNDETTHLLGSDWKGGAATAYGTAWNQWHDGAKKVVEGLQRMSELLDVAGREYGKTDESGAQALGSTMQGSGSGDGGGGGGGNGGPGATTGAAPATSSGAAGGNPAVAAPAGASGLADGLGQALSSAAQLPQTALQPLQQVGQAVEGWAQMAAEMALEFTQRAEHAEDPPADATQVDQVDDPLEHTEKQSDESANGGATDPVEPPDH